MKGFTLIELIVVVIIIGIVAGLSIVSYSHTREKTLDKEAVAGLLLIRSAERDYFARFKRFWPATGVTLNTLAFINGNLSLDLRAGLWNYSLTGGVTSFNASARRPGRAWQSANLTGNPACTGTCY
jgi:prepilin-type N-terminal cleavage/methylation domain-containing protein